jgi:hypothetical protein
MASARVLGYLRDAGVINENSMAALRTGTALSAQGKELIENVLIGKAFQGNPDAVRQLIAHPTMREAVVIALSEISRNGRLRGTGYDLLDELARAIGLTARAKESNAELYKAGTSVAEFGRQAGLFDDEYGSSTVEDVTVLLLADVLNSKKSSELRKVLSLYNDEAVGASAGQMDMFDGKALSKEDILKLVNEHFRNGTTARIQGQVDEVAARADKGKQAGSAAEGGGQGENGTEPTDGGRGEQEDATITRRETDDATNGVLGKEITPSVGPFGEIYTQFKGNPQEAVTFLLAKRGGEAIGALHHKEIGDIDLVWGEEGTGHSDGYGLAKLAKFHPEVLFSLQDILNDMVVTKRTENRVQLESDKYQAAVRLTWDNKKKTWLLTMFEKKNSVPDNTTDTDKTLVGNGNDTATPENTVSSEGKGNGLRSEKQADGGKSLVEGSELKADKADKAVVGKQTSRPKEAAKAEEKEAEEAADEAKGTSIFEGNKALSELRDRLLGAKGNGVTVFEEVEAEDGSGKGIRYGNRQSATVVWLDQVTGELGKAELRDTRKRLAEYEREHERNERLAKVTDANGFWEYLKSIGEADEQRGVQGYDIKEWVKQAKQALLSEKWLRDVEIPMLEALNAEEAKADRSDKGPATLMDSEWAKVELMVRHEDGRFDVYRVTNKKSGKQTYSVVADGKSIDDVKVAGNEWLGTKYRAAGDLLYESLEDAIKGSEAERRQAEVEAEHRKAAEERDKREREDVEAEERRKAELESDLLGFTQGMAPMRKQQAEKLLGDKKIKGDDGKAVSVYVAIKEAAKNGTLSLKTELVNKYNGADRRRWDRMSTEEQRADEERIKRDGKVTKYYVNIGGKLYDLGKTGYDFAQHVLNGVKPKAETDNQGNPIDKDGNLIVESVNSVDEITDSDFQSATRNVQLPKLPQNVDDVIGANGRSVVIKKNVFDKNRDNHKELTPKESREILNNALYNPNLVGKTQPIKRPYYTVVIQTGDKNSVVVLDVYDAKDNIEIVGWRKANEKKLEELKKQAAREGGQFLILSPDEGSAAALSALPSGVVPDSKGRVKSANKQEDGGEKADESAQMRMARDVKAKYGVFGKESAEAYARELIARQGWRTKDDVNREVAQRYCEAAMKLASDDYVAGRSDGGQTLGVLPFYDEVYRQLAEMKLDDKEAVDYAKRVWKRTEEDWRGRMADEAMKRRIKDMSDEEIERELKKCDDLEKYDGDDLFAGGMLSLEDESTVARDVERMASNGALAKVWGEALEAEKAGRRNEGIFKKAQRMAKKPAAMKKAKKFDLFGATHTDPLRGAMTGVYHVGGHMVATDTQIMVDCVGDYPKEYEGTSRDKNGNEIRGKYPSYQQIDGIFKGFDEGSGEAMDVEAFRGSVARAIEAKKTLGRDATVLVEIGRGRKTRYVTAERAKQILDVYDVQGGVGLLYGDNGEGQGHAGFVDVSDG